MSKPREQRVNAVIHFIDRFAKPLVVISVALYLIEGEMSLRNHWDNSYESPRIFLWSERMIDVFFTVEFFVRWWRSNPSFHDAPDT